MKKIIGGFSMEFCIILGTLIGTGLGLAVSQGILHAKVDDIQNDVDSIRNEIEYFEDRVLIP